MCAKESVSINELVSNNIYPSQHPGVFANTLRRLGRHLKMGIGITDAYIFSLKYNDQKKVKAPPIELEIHELIQPNADEIQALANFGFYTNIPEDVLIHLEEGQHCYVAKHKGQIVSCFWMEENAYYDTRLHRKIQFDENEVYNLASYTLPEYRGKGILPYLYQESISSRLSSKPDLHEIAFVDIHNQPSINVVTKVGYKKIGHIGYINVFGIRFQYILGKNVLPKTKNHFMINH